MWNMKSSRAVALAVLLALALVLGTMPGLALAQTDPQMAPPFVTQVAANSTVDIPINGFCLNYGLPFPGLTMNPTVLAPFKVRQAIAYAVQKGYVTTEPWQTQLAVWYFIEGQQVNDEYGPVAEEIIAFVESGPEMPEAGSTAMLLTDALDQGLVTATIDDYTNISPPDYFFIGEGTLKVTNLTSQTLTLLIPYGVRAVEVGASGNQDMGIFPKPGTVPPDVPPTGGFLAPEVMALLGLAGASGGVLTVRRLRKRA